jgi:type I restriction enzyme M protein
MSIIKKMSKSLESVVNYIRNVLRKEGITGMDSINHCIAFIVCRTLNDETCEQLDIDKKYSYENMMKNKDGKEIGDQDLFDKFYSGNANSFIGQLATKLGFKNMKFKLQGIQNLKDIMKKLKDIDPKHIDSKYDIIGTIYEIHLKSGTSNAMRDLGQYYTHRLVIDYMIKLCEPKMEKGQIEKIVDPTMGTGGFLTMAIKHLNEKYKNKIDWAKNKNNIIGFDIDDNVRNMALLNIFLESGELCDDTICKQDTLYNDMLFEDGTIMKKAKIILANEPMGLKNIVLASCCERIKKGLKAGTKAEPLFLKLFMEALDDGGRCAVIVPDGTLFGDSTLHNFVRKMLIEEFNLKKIISLNDDFFLNTGVKTSILYFVKDGTKTKEIEFGELKLKDDKIEENSIIKVKYDDLKKSNYSLFVNKYNIKTYEKVIGIEYEKLEKICIFKNGTQLDTKNIIDGNFPVYGGGKSQVGYHNSYNREGCETIVCGTGSCGFVNRCLSGKFWASQCFTIETKDEKILLNSYLYYYTKLFLENIFMENKKGSTQPYIRATQFYETEIPIPDIQIQKQIVEILDKLNNNNETCKNQIEESNYILKKYIEFNSKGNQKKIGDICETKSGKFNSKDKKETGKYPFYTSEVNSPVGFSDEFCFDFKEYLILIKDGGAGQGKYGDQIGLGKVFKVKGKSCATSHQYAIIIKDDVKDDVKEITNDYLYLYLSTKKNQIMDLAMYTTGLGCIRKGDFDNLTIEYPSIEKQKEIIDFCNEMQNNIDFVKKQIKNNNDMMKKAFEYLMNDNKDDKKKDDSDSEECEKLKKVNKAKKDEVKKDKSTKDLKKKKTDKKAVSSSESDSDSDSESEKKTKSTKDLKKKKVEKKVVSSSESDSDSDSDSSSSESEKDKKSKKKSKVKSDSDSDSNKKSKSKDKKFVPKNKKKDSSDSDSSDSSSESESKDDKKKKSKSKSSKK